ncbi:MAG: hypothetical protein QW251_05865 [Desulfurococcaceae archaeon]
MESNTIYKHSDLNALFSQLRLSPVRKLILPENQTTGLNIIGYNFYLRWRRPSFEEFRQRVRLPIARELFSLGVVRIFWTMDGLGQLPKASNTAGQWFFKDVLSDRVKSYQAFSLLDGYLAIVLLW